MRRAARVCASDCLTPITSRSLRRRGARRVARCPSWPMFTPKDETHQMPVFGVPRFVDLQMIRRYHPCLYRARLSLTVALMRFSGDSWWSCLRAESGSSALRALLHSAMTHDHAYLQQTSSAARTRTASITPVNIAG